MSYEETTWRRLIVKEMTAHGDRWDRYVQVKVYRSEDGQRGNGFDSEFDAAFGGDDPDFDFALWTKDRVYFPLGYDGSKTVGSVRRFPDVDAVYYR